MKRILRLVLGLFAVLSGLLLGTGFAARFADGPIAIFAGGPVHQPESQAWRRGAVRPALMRHSHETPGSGSRLAPSHMAASTSLAPVLDTVPSAIRVSSPASISGVTGHASISS